MKLNVWKLGIFLFVVFAFFANSLHESYPDEFDNILGGWRILHGSLPYTGFFTHHGPVPYFIAALIEIFSGQSFVVFRIVYAFLLILITFATFIFLRERVGAHELRFYPFFIVFMGVSATYYWTQMLLADNVAALAFLPVFALIILKAIYKKFITLIDIAAVSILSSVGLYSSLTYIYIFVLMQLAILYLYFKSNGYKPLFSIKNIYPIAIVIFPHILLLLYLLVAQSLSDYIYQNFIFNAKYYIYNYPRSSESAFINPLRYAILIAHWFFVNFYTLLLGALKFDFSYPLNLTMAIGNVALVIYLLLNKHYKLAAFVVLMIIYANVRSNPLNSKETDYQSAAYNVFSFFNIFFLLPKLYESLNANIAVAKKILLGFLLLFLGIYSFFTLLHLTFKFNSKVVSKYMGDMPLIYDRPKIAPIVNAAVDKNEYAWIGPFEFEELFYTNSKIPSKYHILVYGIGASEKIRTEMISDFQNNKPKVIIFDKEFVYLGKSVGSYSEFFLRFLSENYITLFDYSDGSITYRFVNQPQNKDKFNLESKTYIRKDKVGEVIKKLLERKYIKQVNE